MTDRIRADDLEQTLRTDMTVNIEITPINDDGTLGVFLSRTYQVTDGDPGDLTPFPIDEILVAG
ncbi:MAG: hypothetical protein ACRD29_11655 [Acidimicrobiales bacterium]